MLLGRSLTFQRSLREAPTSEGRRTSGHRPARSVQGEQDNRALCRTAERSCLLQGSAFCKAMNLSNQETYWFKPLISRA